MTTPPPKSTRDTIDLPLRRLLISARRHPSIARYEAVTSLLAQRVLAAADVIDSYERTISELFALAEEAVAVMESHDPAAKAREVRTVQSDLQAQRARYLRDIERLKPASIAFRMTRDEGREDRPYDARQVRKWLKREPKNGTD